MAAAAATRLIHMTATVLGPRSRSLTPTFLRFSPRLFPKPLFFSTTLSTVEAGPTAWPEWGEFLEKLKSKGYFEKELSEGEMGSEGRNEYSKVKTACLGFARDRPDLLRSLPREDIRAVVECGCPNLQRKSVNSAKRLRVYVDLDEGNVCSSCNLKGSCDKAYVLSKEEEGARTVDIIRILLQYAIVDQTFSNKSGNPQLKDSAEESARRLLSEFIKLSDTEPDPELLKALVEHQKREPVPRVSGFNGTRTHQNVEMKRGDWICTQCNFMNFARNLRCLECNADGPNKVGFSSSEMMKRGDWTCPQCQFMNFARNLECKRCQGPRPQRELEPGEWECPSCTFLNFRRNDSCLKCNCGRPEDEYSQTEDNVWRRPKLSSEASRFMG